MAINSLGINLNRREWLKMATGTGALILAAPLANLEQLHAQERTLSKELSRIESKAKFPYKESAAHRFGSDFANGTLNKTILQRSGNGRDLLYEILRLTTSKDFINKTYSVKGKNDWDFVLDLREFASYVLDAQDPNREGARNDHFIVQNLRKKDSVKVNLDEIVDFGINVKSAWLGSLTLGAIAGGFSPYALPKALGLINEALDVLDYDDATAPLRRDIEKVLASMMFGETGMDILYRTFKYQVHQDGISASYKAGEAFNRLSTEAENFAGQEALRQRVLLYTKE